jgi:hypothetical protein
MPNWNSYPIRGTKFKILVLVCWKRPEMIGECWSGGFFKRQRICGVNIKVELIRHEVVFQNGVLDFQNALTSSLLKRNQ